jgi:putative phosphoribosyl transferase
MREQRFVDRADAGRRLGELLVRHDLVAPVVLALPRGGVPVAFEIADRLGAPLDVLVSRKVGAPGHEEFGVGAVAEGGVRIADPVSLRALRIDADEFEHLADRAVAELDRRVTAYRGARALPELAGRDVVVVDDGVATGVTAEAAIVAVRRLGACRVVLAAPVCAADTAVRLGALADEVVSVSMPDDLRSVGSWYDRFDQTPDRDVVDLLDRARAC